MRTIFVAAMTVLAAIPGITQAIEVGIKGGVPIIDAFRIGGYGCSRFGCSGGSSATRRYVVGAAVEFQLPSYFSIEFNALYKRLGYDFMSATLGNLDVFHYSTTANSWEYPLILHYRANPLPRLKAHAGGGIAFRHLSGFHQLAEHTFYKSFSPPLIATEMYQVREPSNLDARFDYGAVAAFGVDLRACRIRISPELRYTRWASEGYAGANSSRRNQAEFLLGIGVISRRNGDASYQDISNRLSFGVTAGVPLLNALTETAPTYPVPVPQFHSSTHRYIVGGTIEGSVVRRYSLEFDALRRTFEYSLEYQGGFNQTSEVTAWDFPLIIKRRFDSQYAAGAGVVFRHTSTAPAFDINLRRRLVPGAVFTAGRKFGRGHVGITPEIRYTRWASDSFASYSGRPTSNRNQVDVLIGLCLQFQPSLVRGWPHTCKQIFRSS